MMATITKVNSPELRFPSFTSDWKRERLSDIVSFSKGSSLSKEDLSEEGNPCILYGELYTKYNEVITKVFSQTNTTDKKLVRGQKNDIIIPSSGETAIDIACASSLQVDNVLLGGDLNILRPKGTINSLFLSYELNHARKRELAKVAQGATVVHLYNENMKSISVFLPEVNEQQKIASFFFLLDQKIEKQKEKIKELEMYQKGMIQKVFSQAIRFKDNNGSPYPEWKTYKIGDCFAERLERGFPELELLAVTIKQGVSQRTNIDIKDTSSDDKSNYKLVQPNDIVYNSMRMWQGASGVSKYTGIVSPAYTVLRPNKKLYSDFFGYLFKTPKMIYQFKKYSQGLTSDTWNLKYPQIKDIPVNVPSISEQQRIVQFFKTLDEKIVLERERLKQLSLHKQSLIQKMFI